MIKLGVLDNPRMAQAFVDYMAAMEIDVQLGPEEEGRVGLWLISDINQEIAEKELADFLTDPTADKYFESSWKVAETRTATFNYGSTGLVTLLKQQAGPFTLSLMVTCAAVYVFSWLGFIVPIFDLLHFPESIDESWQVWRWFSHGLIHFSTLHLVFNLIWWWVLGGRIEQKQGALRLFQVFLISAAFSGLAQYLSAGPNFGGLSGVVYALLGYVWFLGYFAPQKGIHIERAYIGFMLAWLVIGFFEPFGMQIANIAHLAGLISGCVMGWSAAKVKD